MLGSTALISLLLWGASTISGSLDLRDVYPRWTPSPVKGNVGSKLILTPYIESGNAEEARDLSRVSGSPFSDDIPSYSGFFTVNETYNSNMFFWFFPAEQGYESAPLILWLQGGPGSSSLYGLFRELGPFSVASDKKTLVNNPYSWHQNHSVLFIDNPVGTGFSFTEDDAGFPTDEVQVGAELYSALLQFLQVFPELQKVPFYVSGESYAGKFVPALAYTIHNNNPSASLKVNLQGITIGNGFTDPVSFLHYSDLVYQLGLVDSRGYDEIKILETEGIQNIEEGKFVEAYRIREEILHKILQSSFSENSFNFMYPKLPADRNNYVTFVQKNPVRRALHVGDAVFSNGKTLQSKMIPDKMQSVLPWLEVLLDHYKVLCYTGQMDLRIPYPGAERMYKKMKFKAAEEYLKATRVSWHVDGELAGFMKSAGNFTEVLVRNAGHMVPEDQPKWAFDLINRFTNNEIS